MKKPSLKNKTGDYNLHLLNLSGETLFKSNQ